WSPDGKQIVFADEYVATPLGRASTSKLWLADVATGKTQKIFDGDAVQPSWSPHGDRIAFWGLLKVNTGQRDLATISAKGGDLVRVTDDPPIDWNPVWSPDGKYLYFSSDRGGSMNLWRVSIDEHSGKTLGEPQAITTPSHWSGAISLSKDGTHIAYSSSDNQSHIEKVAFDPSAEKIIGAPQTVTSGTNRYVDMDVSPDEEWLVFRSIGGQEDIYISKADGSEIRKLTDDIYKDRGPVWSPDGKKIL